MIPLEDRLSALCPTGNYGAIPVDWLSLWAYEAMYSRRGKRQELNDSPWFHDWLLDAGYTLEGLDEHFCDIRYSVWCSKHQTTKFPATTENESNTLLQFMALLGHATGFEAGVVLGRSAKSINSWKAKFLRRGYLNHGQQITVAGLVRVASLGGIINGTKPLQKVLF